ncbi:MAG: DNA-3-methyladenine glycosylase 2 family protein [Micavibrio aeruginosavorus]|uniref:DNA-3-methyladenine glycosylase II n=1 Tax=Micavibrio aeruginosavorus TaxID=349221 RepID=A0A7T5UGA0_9BACT|nr:MAG: DNA-3-methyladenine glycosylase 2 family protein [Micavibrio aeruginosavorus]
MKYLHEVPHIRAGLDYLLLNDRVFKKLDIVPEHLAWRYTAPGYDSLVRIVIGQQVSTKAAQSIWKKFKKEIKNVTPARVLKMHDDELRALGLSGQKVKYIRGLSEAVQTKSFDPQALEALSDNEVYDAITRLKGFGRWSAEMYLMFSLARPDIWAPADLGIQDGLRIYHRRAERPSAEEALKMGKKFAPHRTAASILLWYLKGVS